MIYRPQTINFREVFAGDTFIVELTIDTAYEIKPDTLIVMTVTVATDLESQPILRLDSSENEITKNGQKLIFSKATPLRIGRFKHTIQFTTDAVTVTLYEGLFEIIQ